MGTAVVERTTISVTASNNVAVTSDGTIELQSSTLKAQVSFKSNDYIVAPRYTTFDVSVNSIPPLIQASLDNLGTGIQSQIDADRDRLDAIDDGTNTQIVLIKNATTSLTGEFDSYKASNDAAVAGILVDYITKVENDVSESALYTVLTNETAGLYVSQAWAAVNMYTKTAADEAIATLETSLSATLDSMDAKYNQTLDVYVDEFGVARSTVIESMSAVGAFASAAYTLELDVNGYISGFKTENDGHISTFDIVADVFKVYNGTSAVPMFSVSGSKIALTTNVEISGALMVSGSVWTSGVIQSSDFTSVGGAGFRLKSGAAATYTDPTIYGAYIRGATLDSSTMRVRDVTVVTDAGYDTASTYDYTVPSSSVAYTGSTVTTNLYLYTGIYTYNNTVPGVFKLAGASGNLVAIRNGVSITEFAERFYAKIGRGFYPVGSYGAVVIHVYIGGTSKASYTVPASNGTYYTTLYGIRFVVVKGGSYEILVYMETLNTVATGTDNGELRVVQQVTMNSSGSTFTTSAIQVGVNNI